MSTRRASTAFKVGLFTLLGTSLGIAALLALGAGLFDEDRVRIETYFAESVHGLNVGAPVKLRGVNIGQIEQIQFARNLYQTDPADPKSVEWSKKVVVVASINPNGFPGYQARNIESLIESAIGQGLRMQLAFEGISGLLYLEADFWPKLKGKVSEPPWIPNVLHIPARSSTITQVSTAISDIVAEIHALDMPSLVTDFKAILEATEALFSGLDGPQLQAEIVELLSGAHESSQQLRSFLNKIDQSPLIGQAESTLDELNTLARSLNELLSGARVQGMITNLETSSEGLPSVLARADRGLSQLDLVLSDSQRDIPELLHSLKAVLDQLEGLTAGLRGQPSRALFGEPPPPSRPHER